MKCPRCQTSFCWCCMSKRDKNHNRWYSLCPSLPFSLCVNIILVLLAIIFMHLICVVVVIGLACYYSYDWILKKLLSSCMISRKNFYGGGCRKACDYTIWIVLYILIILPLALALAGAAIGLLIGLGTLPALYYGFGYIIRVIYNTSSN